MTDYEPGVDADDEYDDEDEDDDQGNRLVGGIPKRVLEHVAKAIADEPDAVTVDVEEGDRDRLTLRLHVSPDDMGKVIGKRGRTAAHLRTVVRAAGAIEGVDASVDIVD